MAALFERKSIRWVLARTSSWFAPLVEKRLDAGEKVTARMFAVDGARFAEVRFERVEHPDLVLALEARR